MKLTIFFISILITTAFCKTIFQENSTTGQGDHPNYNEKITDFFISFFKYFGLAKPVQILRCFDEENAEHFFKSLWETSELLKDANDRMTFRFNLDLIKWEFLDRELRETHVCMATTQDFTALLDALDVKKRDPKHISTAFNLYYQAHYAKLLEDFTPIIQNLKNKNVIAAGDAFAALLSNLFDTVHDEGNLHLAYAGFSNGQATELDIDNPKDSLECFDNESAGLYLEFTYKLAEAVTSGTWKDSAINANNFWENEGKAIMNKIPESAWECFSQSGDAEKLQNKLGVDVTDMSFINMMLKYNSEHRFSYYTFMKSLKCAFDHFEFNRAGTIDAHYTKAIIASNSREH